MQTASPGSIFPAPSRSTTNAACNMPANTGLCRASIPRWFWNTASGMCEAFIFGGCGGNSNNFESQAECESACKPGSPLALKVLAAESATSAPGDAHSIAAPNAAASSPSNSSGMGRMAVGYRVAASIAAAALVTLLVFA